MKSIEIRLGFDRIRRQIADLCSTQGARELVAEMDFATSLAVVEERQALAEEVREALLMAQEFPKGELVEFSHVVAKLAVEGTFLECDELVALRSGLRCVGEARRVFLAGEERYPRMAALSKPIGDFPEVVGHIDTIIDRHGKDAIAVDAIVARSSTYFFSLSRLLSNCWSLISPPRLPPFISILPSLIRISLSPIVSSNLSISE